MQLLFIDESGTIPPKNKAEGIDCFTLGGIVIPEDIWFEVDKELDYIKNRFCIVGEIKWRNFAPQKPGAKKHSLSHLSSSEKEQVRFCLYQIVCKFKSIRLICVVVNVKTAYTLAYIQSENDLYWYAYKQMTERFQYYLQDLSRIIGNKINGIIICDHRQPKDDHQLRILHQKLLTSSKNHFSRYKNLIEGVFIAPSHLSVGIQFADLIAGAVYRKYAKNDPRNFDYIKSSFRKNSDGKIEGYGLIEWPKKIR